MVGHGVTRQWQVMWRRGGIERRGLAAERRCSDVADARSSAGRESGWPVATGVGGAVVAQHGSSSVDATRAWCT